MNRTIMMNKALEYYHNGYDVIPCDDKRPMIRFSSVHLNEEQIKQWWERYPYANIALHTDKFFVIDIDKHTDHEKGKVIDGVTSFKALHHNEWLEGTRCQHTAGGGYQYFFLKPKDTELRQNIGIIKGVDIKAHNNNYVMVPPSKIKGGYYQWIKDIPMKEPPTALLDWLIAKQARPIHKSPFNFNIVLQKNNQSESSFRRYSTLFVNGLGDQGTRNITLTKLIGYMLGQYVLVPLKEAFELAILANLNTPEPLGKDEFIKTFISIAKKERGKDLEKEDLEGYIKDNDYCKYKGWIK